MRNFRILSLLLITLQLTACGLFGPAPEPTPGKLASNLERINSGTIINVVSLVPMDIPNPSESAITNTTVFRVSNDLREYPNSSILIPQNALVTGIYTNNGKTCSISWQAIYANYTALEKGQGAMTIAPQVQNTSCDPKTGIRAGQLMNITFK